MTSGLTYIDVLRSSMTSLPMSAFSSHWCQPSDVFEIACGRLGVMRLPTRLGWRATSREVRYRQGRHPLCADRVVARLLSPHADVSKCRPHQPWRSECKTSTL